MKRATVAPAVGQIWQRRDGTIFEIEKIRAGYVVYWLATGSRPQFRQIALENLKARYSMLWPSPFIPVS